MGSPQIGQNIDAVSEILDFREVGEEHGDTLREIVQYSFFPESGADPESWGERHMPDEIFTRWGMFAGDELVGVLHSIETSIRIRGEKHDVSGGSTLAVPPEYRNKGVVAGMVVSHAKKCVENGINFIVGYPFPDGYNLYRHVGLEMVSKTMSWECEPEALLTSVDAPSGRYRRVGPDDWDILDSVYEEFAEQFALTIDRTEEWWRTFVFEPPNASTRHAAVWERDGSARGYVVYKFSERAAGTTLQVRLMGYTDQEAYRHLLYYLGTHNLQVSSVKIPTPADPTIFDIVDSPSGIDCTVGPGAVLRILDVKSGLEELSYPATLDKSISVRVTDDFLKGNDDTYRLSIAGKTATCEATDEDPDVTIDIGSLAQLVVGYRSVAELERAGDLTVHADVGREALTTAFPPTQTHLPDRF